MKMQNQARKRFLFIPVFLIIILGFVTYLNSLNGKFIWDDYALVKDNAHIKSKVYLIKLFTERIGGGYTGGTAEVSNFYRPLQMLTYMIDYHVFGLNAFGFHFTNVLLHISVGLCLYWLIITLFTNNSLALISSLLYIVHPVHVEAVASIAGRADSLSAIFILLSIIFYVKMHHSFNIFSYLLTLFCFICALLSKESSIILPLALLLYHYVFKKKINLSLFLSALCPIFIYILMRWFLLAPSSLKTYNITVLFERIPGFFVAVVNYFRILLLPIDLHVHYGELLFKFTDKKAIFGMLLSFLAFFYALKNKERNNLLLFSTSWFFVFLLPAANIYPINDSFMKEHWLYIPSIGFFLIMSQVILALYRNKKTKIFGFFCIIGALVFYSLCTIKQNNYWREPIKFFERSLSYASDYPIFYTELAAEYENIGKFEEAAKNYKKALGINPNLIGVYHNLGILYEKAGKYEEAILAYQQALGKKPEDILVYYVIANCYNKIGNKEKAMGLRKQAEGQRLKLAQKYHILGDEYKDTGDNKKAIASYEKALEFDQNNIVLYNKLAGLYIIVGEYDLAILLLGEALKINPDLALIHNDLAVAHYYKRDYGLAIKHCDKAIGLGYKVEPGFLDSLKKHRK